LPILPIEDIETAYYLRMTALDKLGVLAKVTQILSEQQISIEAIIQKEPLCGAPHVSVVILTHKVVEKQLNQAIQAIENLEGITGEITRIRLEILDG